ncbi:MAG: cell division protein ZapA [Proteobacteria bacterium]|nr:cell division protein ZapA [Pseudomonadota bacterium]
MGNLVEFEILGQSLAVKSGEGEESVKKVASYLEERIEQVKEATGVAGSHRLLLYTAFQMANENLKVKAELKKLEEEVDSISSNVLEMFEHK